MRISYWFLNVLLALLGGFMMLESQAFASGTAGDIGFACGIGVLVLSLATLTAAVRRGGPAFRGLAALSSLIGAWTIIATAGTFSASVTKWLTFADGGAVLALALIALGLHEITTERVVHSIEVGEQATVPDHAGEREPERQPAY
jgi:hypothetical protein